MSFLQKCRKKQSTSTEVDAFTAFYNYFYNINCLTGYNQTGKIPYYLYHSRATEKKQDVIQRKCTLLATLENVIGYSKAYQDLAIRKRGLHEGNSAKALDKNIAWDLCSAAYLDYFIQAEFFSCRHSQSTGT